MPAVAVSWRALVLAVAVVLTANVGTLYAVHRMVASTGDASRVSEDRTSVAASATGPFVPSRPPAGPTQHEGPHRLPILPALPLPPRAPIETMAKAGSLEPSVQASKNLAPEVRQFADAIRVQPKDLRLFTDQNGRISESAQNHLRTGREVALRIAAQQDVRERADTLAGVAVGYMLRRANLRDTLRNTGISSDAIDATVRADALANVEANVGGSAKEAIAGALPQLPDLTLDVLGP
jgi:hypothetical protein